ncbi:hypothetical protein EMCG_08463 [[Emmonsia] crescens]|uniref:Alcohol dehydrogenase-like N-terminal domain-containing protein n=1 Tax=[Emmonsia] crescens TaxID=73230 RepID=A0A0G2J4B8_9EURO|nr:hypothetical protein EMCG_08463 [Emmonsia crescens UAMH 3008]
MALTKRGPPTMDEVENDAKRRKFSKPTSNFEIPKTCKAGVVINPGRNFSVKIEEVSVPEPADIHCIMGKYDLDMASKGVRSAGHEGVGVVVKVGSGVTDIEVGTRGGIGPICYPPSRIDICELINSLFAPTGTFQEYITFPSKHMPRTPEKVSDEIAACLMCHAGPIYGALKKSGLNPKDWALFFGGASTLNGLYVQFALALDMYPIVVADRTQRKLCL